MWHSDLILGLQRASLQGRVLVLLWIISALVLKRSMEVPFEPLSPQTLLHRFDFHVLACFSNYFFSIFSVHLSSTIDLMKDTFTTCRTRQACWWRRSTQAQWYKVTSTAVENSPEVHEEMILTERSVKLSHMTPSHLIFASSVFLLPHAAQQVLIQTVTLF